MHRGGLETLIGILTIAGCGASVVPTPGADSGTGDTTVIEIVASQLGTTPAATGMIGSPPSPFGTTGLAVGDFDGDGFADLVVSDLGTTVFRGNPMGLQVSFGMSLAGAPTGRFGAALMAGDLNNDGYADLADVGNATSALADARLYLGSRASLQPPGETLQAVVQCLPMCQLAWVRVRGRPRTG